MMNFIQQPQGMMENMQDPMMMGMQQPMGDPMMGQMPPQEPITNSPLDRWAYREYGKLAWQLVDDELDKLYDQVLTFADNDVETWKSRNERMLASQRFWELGSRYAEMADDENAGEHVELNDGYLTVDKLTSMVAGAHWGFDVPPKDVGYEDVAQNIEDMLRWADQQLEKKNIASMHGTLIRDETHYALLRGWITGMVLPNPEDPILPWTYLLEDPLFVYPRYSGEKLIRVTHRYSMSVLEAQSTFQEAFKFLVEKEEDDDVEVTSYYDEVYRITLLNEGGLMRDRETSQYVDRVILLPLTQHGYKDLFNRPINPWIIVTPRGSPTRKFAKESTKADKDKAMSFIGLDCLYPIKDIIVQFERLMSMWMTEVAKGVNPPKIIFYDGSNKPQPIDMGEGAENYFIMHTQDAKILESTMMKPDIQPLIQTLQDRLQRGSVPSVLYGQAGFQLAGYAINLLSQGAQDVLQPTLAGVKTFREIRYSRMLEMYANIGASFAGNLGVGSTDAQTGIRYASAKTVSPLDIVLNGSYVEVKYDDIMPRDAVPLLTAAVAGNQAGILPLYDAMKDWIGIKDPKAALHRLAEGLNYKDPLVQKHLARQAGMASGNADLRNAVMAAVQEEMMIQQMQMQLAMAEAEAGGKGEGSKKGNPNTAGGANKEGTLEGSPPSNQNPITASTNQLANVTAALNVGNGASPPNPVQAMLPGMQ